MKMAADFAALSHAHERSDSKFEARDQAERTEDAFVRNGTYGVGAAWAGMYAVIIMAGLLKSFLG